MVSLCMKPLTMPLLRACCLVMLARPWTCFGPWPELAGWFRSLSSNAIGSCTAQLCVVQCASSQCTVAGAGVGAAQRAAARQVVQEEHWQLEARKSQRSQLLGQLAEHLRTPAAAPACRFQTKFEGVVLNKQGEWFC